MTDEQKEVIAAVIAEVLADDGDYRHTRWVDLVRSEIPKCCAGLPERMPGSIESVCRVVNEGWFIPYSLTLGTVLFEAGIRYGECQALEEMIRKE